MFAIALAAALLCTTPTEPAATADQKAIQAFARGIEALKKDYPQLAGFSASKSCQVDALTISHEFKTHPPARRGGWTSGVPNPDPDGIWFYIDIHSPDSTAQIHTQPVVEQLCLGKRRVQFLILEGEKTKPVAGAIRAVLLANGVARCTQ